MKRLAPARGVALAHLSDDLASLAAAGLLRERPRPGSAPTRLTSFGSNDYLGLASTPPDPLGAPVGAGASRLLGGDHPAHRELEQGLADWLSLESALLFSSGYATNVGVLSALVGPQDLIVSDELNHASIVDGCRLSRATIRTFPHLDVSAVPELLAAGDFRRRWVVTESYFSMDADSPDLRALRSACDARGAALLVDEAHALGVLGPGGRGLAAESGISPDVLVGTLGKAFGASGAFVAGSSELTAWLWNRARSFVFSTGLSPAVAAAGSAALDQIQRRPDLRAAATARALELRAGLLALGLSPRGYGHIVPVVFDDAALTMRLAERLRASGFDVRAIRPPSVPIGSARIRLTGSAAQTSDDVARFLDALKAALA